MGGRWGARHDYMSITAHVSMLRPAHTHSPPSHLPPSLPPSLCLPGLIASSSAITHVRYTIFPDGGTSRIRLWGKPEVRSPHPLLDLTYNLWPIIIITHTLIHSHKHVHTHMHTCTHARSLSASS
jgi:hypothetical protein